MKGNLLTIGETSKLTGVPVKSIRHYCDMGVVKPAYVDKENNYRYFTQEKVVLINLIKSMRELAYSLEDIRKFLYEENFEIVREKLITSREEKAKLILKLKSQIEVIDDVLVEREKLYPVKKDGEEYSVEIKYIEDRFVVFREKTINPIYSIIKKSFNDINRVIARDEILSKETSMIIYNIEDIEKSELTACFCVEADYSSGILSPNVKILQQGKFLSLTYVGKYKTIRSKIYPYMLEWMSDNGHEYTGEVVEIFNSKFEEGHSDDNIFEIQIRLK